MKAVRVAAAALLLLLSACARRNGGEAPFLAPAAGGAAGGEVFQAGIASWYGDDFHGRTTADGEVYDMYKLTAAHPNLPFHTIVEVENVENGRRVPVRINDRGPFLKERIIDLSLEAARRLGMAEKGTAEVRLRVMRWGGPPAAGGASAAELPGTRPCFVQAGAFAELENAEELLLTLGEIFPDMAFRIVEEDGMYKVLSPELDAPSCRDVIRRLAAQRLPGFIRESGPRT